MSDGQEQPVRVDDLLPQYLPTLEAYVRLRAGPVLRGQESCQDLAQSVCRELLTKRSRLQFDGEEGFRKWLFTTARRKLADRLDYYRAEKRNVHREVRGDHRDGSAVTEEILLRQYGTFCTPSRHVEAKEELRRVEEVFDKLPADYQEVILMARLLGMSRQQIGEQMNRSETAVRALLYRALAALAEGIVRGEPDA